MPASTLRGPGIACALILVLVVVGCPNSGTPSGQNDNSSGQNDNSNYENDNGVFQNGNSNSLDDSTSQNDNGAGQNDNSDTVLAHISGTWQRVSGELVAGQGDALKYLVLQTSGDVEAYVQDATTSVMSCYTGTFTQPSQTTLLISADYLAIESELLVEQPDPDSLTLTCDDASAAFTRAAAVPDDLHCRELTVLHTYPGLPTPSGFTNLVSGGGHLWYTISTGDLQALDPATGELEEQVEFLTTQFRQIQAYEAGGFWAHCACGGSPTAELRSVAEVLLDEFDTDADLGSQLTIRAIAVDLAAQVLWVFGYWQDDETRLLIVDSAASPKTLIAQHDLALAIKGLSWDGRHLWMVLNSSPQKILEVDPATLKAVRTYSTPDPQVAWQGVAMVGTSVYLLGSWGDSGVVIEAQP